MTILTRAKARTRFSPELVILTPSEAASSLESLEASSERGGGAESDSDPESLSTHRVDNSEPSEGESLGAAAPEVEASGWKLPDTISSLLLHLQAQDRWCQ